MIAHHYNIDFKKKISNLMKAVILNQAFILFEIILIINQISSKLLTDTSRYCLLSDRLVPNG